MGHARWGLGICPMFMCFFLLTFPHKWTATCCSEQERQALVNFKQTLWCRNGMLSTWGVGNDCCRWERVGCDNITGKVVSLHLRGHVKKDDGLVDQYGKLLIEEYGLAKGFLRGDLVGYLEGDEVSPCLTKLVNLKHLDLSGNSFFRKRIPEFIGSLKQLRYLNLSGSAFSGYIPHEIGNLSNLKVLDLSSRHESYDGLMTDDMTWISGLLKLKHLDLSGVSLNRTLNLDILLYKAPSLTKLSLSRCGLSISHLGSHNLINTDIKYLDLSENDFRGQFPRFFLNMTSLEFLDLSSNNVSISWNFENFLQVIPFVSKLRLSNCNIQKINFSPLSFSINSSIQHLDLSLNKIEGIIPYVLTNMSSLISLNLSKNRLNSSVPFMPNLLKLDISRNNYRYTEDVGIWRHCHLKELIVSSNNLEGEMIGPSTNVSKCSQYALEILYLNQNKLNCSIPESLGRLTNLRELDLSFNRLTGPIPVFLGRIASLRVLSMSSNFLNETIPNSIGQLTKLYRLDVSNNSFQGVVSDDHFANLRMLKYLNADYNYKLHFNISTHWVPPFQLKVVRLHSCKIQDGFPQWFRNQMNLKELVLSNASISGPLPTWLRLMPMISILDLSHNKLTGTLTNLHSVHEAVYELGGMLILQNNLFKGSIPWWLCTRTDLKVLDLSRNRLTGIIPNCIWSLPLEMVLLSSNRLHGAIPSPLGYHPFWLQWLQLNDNNLSGELPDFGPFRSLMVLDLGENKISGIIPEWSGEELLVLRMHKNNFIGELPSFLCRCNKLHILDLAQNNLTGSIPYCYKDFDGMKEGSDLAYWGLLGYGNVMQVLKGAALNYSKTMILVRNMDLSSNKLSGEIPNALTTLDGLMSLNLSYNCFTGSIPEDIGNMKSLNSLDLSWNKLTGVIPPSMGALNFLSYLNLSHNNLSAQIPTGNQLQTLIDPSIYADNPYLCGAPLLKKCSPHESTRSKNKYKNGKVWFYLDIMSGFATGFWGIIGVLLLKKQWRHKLFMFSEVAMDTIYVAVATRVLKMKRGRVAA